MNLSGGIAPKTILPNEGIAEAPRTWRRHGAYWAAWGRGPWELLNIRLLGRWYYLRRTIRIVCPVCQESITCEVPMFYDGATYAPDLRDIFGRNSAAFPPHDKAWLTGTFDSGHPISLDHANALMVHILMLEGHPLYGVRRYAWGVSLDHMRQEWNARHHPAPLHIHPECRFVYDIALDPRLKGMLKLAPPPQIPACRAW